MSNSVEALIVDLLDWIGTTQRPYSEVMDAWKTSCPRLPVWEEANAQGLIAYIHTRGTERMIGLSESGLARLRAHRSRAVKHPRCPEGVGAGRS
jgi:hypothetical protein